MENSGEQAELTPELALRLIALRDALTRTSLALHDWQYALDLEARGLAQESLDAILKRCQCQP